MGVVASRPDEGAALYLRDQTRCKFPRPRCHAYPPMLLLLPLLPRAC